MNGKEVAPPSLWTHIALPVQDLDETLNFYSRYTSLETIHERRDPKSGLRTAWLANPDDKTQQAARFALVLIEGELPKDVAQHIEEGYGFLTSISHLGISLNSREEVDKIATMAATEDCLLLGPTYRNEVVGYICLVTDPDGNNVEFSVEQILG